MKLYSASTGGFYAEDIHGSRKVSIIEPGWIHPQIELPEIGGGKFFVDDPDIVPPTIAIDNPDCKIPADAVEITDEYHAQLLDAQCAGKVIQSDANGHPVALDPPPPTDAQLWAARQNEAQALLIKSDMVAMRCLKNRVEYPVTWNIYDDKLRAIINATSGDMSKLLPTQPEYPAGT